MRLIDADALMRKAVELFFATNYFNHISKMIEDAPTVNEWIPVSERLPGEPYGCLAWVKDSWFNAGNWSECENLLPCFIGWDGKQWNDGDGEKCPFEVIAWMPLPEPYKGATEETR